MSSHDDRPCVYLTGPHGGWGPNIAVPEPNRDFPPTPERTVHANGVAHQTRLGKQRQQIIGPLTHPGCLACLPVWLASGWKARTTRSSTDDRVVGGRNSSHRISSLVDVFGSALAGRLVGQMSYALVASVGIHCEPNPATFVKSCLHQIMDSAGGFANFLSSGSGIECPRYYISLLIPCCIPGVALHGKHPKCRPTVFGPRLRCHGPGHGTVPDSKLEAGRRG